MVGVLFSAAAGDVASHSQAYVAPSGVVMLQMPNAHTSRRVVDAEAELTPLQENEEAPKASAALLQEEEEHPRPWASLGQVGKDGAAQATSDEQKAPIHVGNCFFTTYGATMVVLLLLVVLLMVNAVRTRQVMGRNHSKLRALRCQLHHNKGLIKAEEKEIRGMVSALQGGERDSYQEIINRGYVQIDLTTQQLVLKKGIAFEDNMEHWNSMTKFASPAETSLVLHDVADLLAIFHSAVVLIEGHTSTKLEDVDDFAHELAYMRAELVKIELASRGIEEYRLDAIGLPGPLGSNEDKVVLKMIGI